MLETVISSIVAFIGTNTDDIFINALFFSEADTRARSRGVVVGKYLGIGVLVLIGMLGAFGAGFLPKQYVGALGLVPIVLGIKEAVCYLQKRKENGITDTQKKVGGFVGRVMLVTMANGADNIVVYVPLFAGYEPWQNITVVCVFAVMTALWCVLGKKISDLPRLRVLITRYRHVLVPVLYIGLGVYVILKSVL